MIFRKINPLPTAFVAVVASALIAAGCGDDNNSTSDDSDSEDDASVSEDGSDAASISTKSSAADLQVTLDRLLGEHAALAVYTMQKGFDGADDFDAATVALDANTEDLTEAITSVFDEEAGQQFNDMWSAHIGFFVDYTVATASKDNAAKQAALKDLEGYKKSFSEFMATATGLPAEAVAASLEAHVQQLTGALDTYAAGNYEKSYTQIREAYAHMFMTGDALSGGIVEAMPDKFDKGDTTQAAVDTRILLDRLLAEHAITAAFAMQKGHDGAKDFDAIAAALGENTQDLTDTIASVYGEEAGQQFNAMWTEHIGFFVAYTQAVANDDQEAKDKALEDLDGYKTSFAEFMSEATGLPSEALSESLQGHVDQLTAALDSYHAEDYEAAYEQIREAYAHMFMTGDALADAIVQQSPEKFGGSADTSTDAKEESEDDSMEEMPQDDE